MVPWPRVYGKPSGQAGTNEMNDIVRVLNDEFRGVETVADVHSASLRCLSRALSLEWSFVAGERDGNWRLIESNPPGLVSADGPAGLLSPVSLPCLAANQGESCLVDDWTDVRSATTASSPSTATPEIRSLLAVPLGDRDMLVGCSPEQGRFSETDREIAETVAQYATPLLAALEDVADGRDDENRDQGVELERAATALTHDANNYLTIIEGRAELARTEPEPAHFDAIERATSRLSGLVDETATLLLAGGPVTETDWIDLTDAVRLSWDVAGGPDAELEVAPLGRIEANWSCVTRMLENLFRNAIEHAGREVTVRVGPLPAGDGFYIEDDGPGLAPSEAADLFEFDWSSTNPQRGFGLNIVEWIADAHGWEMGLSEADPGGVRFEFSGVDVRWTEE